METIGIIGLGLVGSAIARRLLRAGFGVQGYDLRPEAREAFARDGGKARASAAEIGAACECLVLAVFDSNDVLAAVEEVGVPRSKPAHVSTGDGAGADSAKRHSGCQTIIDCSTGTPEVLQALAQRLAGSGIAFIEAPLSGSSAQIEQGAATQLVAGDEEAIARCAPILDAIASRRVHVGAAGMAAKAKLATNLVLGLNRAVLAEGFAFAESLGIGKAKFLELVLATPARSAAAEAKGAMMISGDFAPQSRIRQHLKDVDLMLALAQAQGQPLPLSQLHADILRRAIAAGDGDLDNAAILRQWARERRSKDPT